MTTPGDFQRTNPRGSIAGETERQRGTEQEGLKGSAQRLAGEAQEQAADVIQSGVSRGKERLAETLGSVAEALRVSSNHLREQNQNVPRQYIDRAAQQVQRFSEYVRRNDPGDLMHGVENFARRQPAVFLGGTFLLGLAGARFLRSSQRKDRDGWYQQGHTSSGYAERGYAQGGYGYGRGSSAGTDTYDDSRSDRQPDPVAERGLGVQTDDVSLRGGAGRTGRQRDG